MGIIDNYNRIRNEVADRALSCSRDPGGITIIAVTKNFPAPVVQEAIDAGIRVLGENRVQEARDKAPLLSGDFTLHMIGHLQGNKARDAVRLFDVIHSIDRIETAERVNLEARKGGKRQKVLVQVNASGEGSKSGTNPADCINLLHRLTDMESVELLGLMTMAPLTDDEALIRKSFAVARGLLQEANEKLSLNLKELSMGMSSDYAIAIEEGATLIRIGTAIFGERKQR